MRFDSIILQNYRQYQDVQFMFPKTKDTDLHLIIASNGVGKTNLMNAITWCLYGDEPHLGNVKESLPIYNLASFSQAIQDRIDEVTISVTIHIQDNSDKYVIKRSCALKVSTEFLRKPKLDICKNGQIQTQDEIDVTISKLLPYDIRDYFFFDAEQLYNYFDDKDDTMFVRDAINNIAQVTLLNTTFNHLTKFEKDNYIEKLNKLNPNLQSISDEINKIKQDIITYKNDIKQLKNQVETSNKRIDEINKLISGSERVVEKNHKYQDNCEEIKIIETKINNKLDEFKSLIQKYIPVLYLYEINCQVKNFIESKSENLPDALNPQILKKSLSDHICACCHRPLNAEMEMEFKDILNKFDTSNDIVQTLISIQHYLIKWIDDAKNYKGEKEKLMDSLLELDCKRNELNKANERLIQYIERYSDISDIESMIKEREVNNKLRESNDRKIGCYQNQLKSEVDLLKEKEEEYKKTILEQDKCDDLKKHIDFTEKALSVIKEISSELVNEVKVKMEKETYTIFKKFIYNDENERMFKYAEVRLTDNYKLQLIHSETHDSCLGSCSAAERQMLALAFTIALHKVSGFDSILFIDTPVGRVSDINRKNFARMLVELSKEKQMIFTFTPSEFSDEIRSYFNDQVCSSFRKLNGSPLVLKENSNG